MLNYNQFLVLLDLKTKFRLSVMLLFIRKLNISVNAHDNRTQVRMIFLSINHLYSIVFELQAKRRINLNKGGGRI